MEPGLTLGYKVTPIASVGVYVPGGTAAYPSTALMTVIPAKVAGVMEVIVCTPPNKDGKINPLTLVAADMAGADRIFKVGGVRDKLAGKPVLIFTTGKGGQVSAIESIDKVVGVFNPNRVKPGVAVEGAPKETDKAKAREMGKKLAEAAKKKAK